MPRQPSPETIEWLRNELMEAAKHAHPRMLKETYVAGWLEGRAEFSDEQRKEFRRLMGWPDDE